MNKYYTTTRIWCEIIKLDSCIVNDSINYYCGKFGRPIIGETMVEWGVIGNYLNIGKDKFLISLKEIGYYK